MEFTFYVSYASTMHHTTIKSKWPSYVVFKKKGVKIVNARRKTNYRNHLNDQGNLITKDLDKITFENRF